MKTILILILLFTQTSFACEMSIPLSYVPTFLNPPVSGHYQKCAAKEECVCIDNVDPYISELITVFESDPETGIYTSKKTFRENEIKKAEHLLDEQEKIKAQVDLGVKKKALLEKLKAIKKSDLTSNAKTVDVLMDVLELLK